MENFDQYYRSYKYMQKHLATDFTANYLTTNMEDNDKGNDVLSGKLHEKVIDMEWVTAIEDTIPYIERAIDEQRRFIIENNEIYRIDKAKIINKDSVKHLIQHTNFIDNIDENGRVTPNKVLTIEREDSFETYENRFLITLIETAMNFVSDKYRKMIDAPTDTYNKVVCLYHYIGEERFKKDGLLGAKGSTYTEEYSEQAVLQMLTNKGQTGSCYEYNYLFHFLCKKAGIPGTYIEDEALKLEMYKRISGVTSREEQEDIIDELTDRFGDVPGPTMDLIKIAYIRYLSEQISVEKIHADKENFSPLEARTRAIRGRNVRVNKGYTYIIDFRERNKLTAFGIVNAKAEFGGRFFAHMGARPFIRLSAEPTKELDQVTKLMEILVENSKTM